MSARFLIASIQDSPEGAQVPIESVPVDGAVPSVDHVADQNAFLLIAFPVIMLFAGAILHLAKRRPSNAAESCMAPGEKGGLILMGIGALLTGLMFVYIMVA